MFDLDKTLKEANVSQEYMAMKIGVSIEHLNQVISSGDENKQVELYEQLLWVLSGDQLIPELLNFYREFFKDDLELKQFLSEAVFYSNSNVPRRMVNTVERLVTLADDIEQVRKGKDGLKIFFLVVCIESLNVLANPNQGNKVGMVIDFFENQICSEDKKLILEMVKRNLADQKFNAYKEGFETEEEYEVRVAGKVDQSFNTTINIETFARIINEVRNIFAHEGSYWEFHFSDGQIPLINCLYLTETRGQQAEERIYEIRLTYSDFRKICVKGFVNFVCKYLESVKVSG